MSSVFNTPRATSNSDAKLLEMVRTKKNRQNSIRELTESVASKAESAENLKKLEAIDADNAAKEILDTEVDERKKRVAKEAASRAMIGLENRLFNAGCKEMFNETIFEMAYNACWIDDSVKENTMQAMYETFNNVIETLVTNGISVNMESDVSPFIKNVREVVTEACCKSAKRIAEDACGSGKTAEEINEIDFGMTQDEIDDLSNSLNDLGKEDIEKLVRDKVLAVVQDEKTKGEEKAEAIKQAKGETPVDGEIVDEENPAEESFNALVNRSRNMKAHRRTGTSLFECMMMSNTNELRQSAATLESHVSDKQIMDAALQETVLVYTIMETLNTLGLCKFNNTNVNKLCNHYRVSFK